MSRPNFSHSNYSNLYKYIVDAVDPMFIKSIHECKITITTTKMGTFFNGTITGLDIPILLSGIDIPIEIRFIEKLGVFSITFIPVLINLYSYMCNSLINRDYLHINNLNCTEIECILNLSYIDLENIIKDYVKYTKDLFVVRLSEDNKSIVYRATWKMHNLLTNKNDRNAIKEFAIKTIV